MPPLQGHVFTAPRGVRGFDANVIIADGMATAFARHGYQFVMRYVRRKAKHAYDLTAAEARAILAAGLALGVVQHVESAESWSPTAAKGTANGKIAAKEATAIGIPPGVCLWCDLEGVATRTPARAVIDYGNHWHSAVAAAGFVPGLYVGYHCGLTATQLYRSLRYTHYWSAYNLNADQAPAVRGVQMRQGVARGLDRVEGFDIDFDTDVVTGDKLGGFPTFVGPDGWDTLVTG
jgi:hypothetical protein